MKEQEELISMAAELEKLHELLQHDNKLKKVIDNKKGDGKHKGKKTRQTMRRGFKNKKKGGNIRWQKKWKRTPPKAGVIKQKIHCMQSYHLCKHHMVWT